ncbi:MAG: acid resistance repetitive basic protein Asr [Syntrophobacteraceae bacterium]
MKKLAYIFGAGVISMAFVCNPVFAQTAQKPATPADATKSVVQEKPATTTPAPVVTEQKAAPKAVTGATTKKAAKEKTVKSKKAVRTLAHKKASVAKKHVSKKHAEKKIMAKHAKKHLAKVKKEKQL